MAPKRYTIAVDFDGVLHPYTAGWTGPEPEDEPPVDGALAAVKALAAKYDVIVFSTRCDSHEGLWGVRGWLGSHGFAPYIKDVTCTKPGALAYIDDRAVVFDGDWDAALAAAYTLVKHGPWGKRA